MYCPQCGSQNSDTARFCLSCGTAIVMGEPAPAPAATPTPTPLPVSYATPSPASYAPPEAFTPVPGAAAVPPVRYAGFWMRFAGWLLDAVALWIVRMALGMVLHGFVSFAVIFCAGWLHFALMESSETQATVGKMVLGLYVTDMEGRRITFQKASGRYFAKILSTLALGIGWIMAAFTERKQALHDLVVGCLVLRR